MNWKRQVKFLREQQEREQAWSATQAKRQMDFQHQETSTAHQREVADLQAAGLNPVLSAGGSGAQSGSGAMANADSILPELLSVMKSMASSRGGARVVVNNDDNEEPIQYFTPSQYKKGIHAGQGSFHGSARGVKGSLDTAERNYESAKEELKKSFNGITFTAGIRGTLSGKITPNGSARITGEQANTIVDAYKKLQDASVILTRLNHLDKAEKNQRMMNSIRNYISRVLKSNKIDPEAKKRVQDIF